MSDSKQEVNVNEMPMTDAEMFVNNVIAGDNVKAKEILQNIVLKKCDDRIKSVLNS